MGAASPAVNLAGRVAALLIVLSAYAPWWAQRRLHSSKAQIRTVVAGRQSGKTHAAAEEVVRVMVDRPGTTSCLLMPTYKSTKGPLRHLRRALAALGSESEARKLEPPPGASWRWLEVDKCFKLWNGSELYVRTADDPSGVPTRGLTLDGILWVDEAAYVPRDAFDAARLTQAAIAHPLVLITTTPCGRNWVYEEFQAGCPGPQKKPLNESFRFRSSDSPHCNPEFIADLREKIGARKALQELDAEFLGDAHAAFDPKDLQVLFHAGKLLLRGEQLTLGIDLAKEQDFVVITLMNEFGEGWVLRRVRDVRWPIMQKEIVDLAKLHGALVVLDLGRGGGYGAMLKDYLEDEIGEGKVLGVKTGMKGVRGEMLELLIADVQAGKLRVQLDALGQTLRHEMTFFEAHRAVVGGVEVWSYHGPQSKARRKKKEGDDQEEDDEDHDDCVLSLALANWGRVHGWEDEDGGDGGLASFRSKAGREGAGRPGPGRSGGGYIFR